MRMEHVVELIDTVTEPNEVGIPVKTETRRDVYADRLSVRRSEHYAANASGVRADIVYAIMADEYNEEAELEHSGRRYKVVRAYQAGQGRVELTCAYK